MTTPTVTTRHLNVAAFLLLRGFKPTGGYMDGQGDKVIFVFLDPSGTGEGEIQSYYDGATAAIIEYTAALKRARDIIWEIKTKRENQNEQRNTQ